MVRVIAEAEQAYDHAAPAGQTRESQFCHLKAGLHAHVPQPDQPARQGRDDEGIEQTLHIVSVADVRRGDGHVAGRIKQPVEDLDQRAIAMQAPAGSGPHLQTVQCAPQSH